MAKTLGGGMLVKKFSGQNVGELHRVGRDGRLRKSFAFGGNYFLKTAPNPATDSGGKPSEERLIFGHA